MASAEGEGSMWNSGSWHWETKSFTKAMVGMVTDGLAAIEVTASGLTGTITKVVEVTGDVSTVPVEGGKQTIRLLSSSSQWF